MHGHPNLPRFQAQMRRAAKYAERVPYWEGSLAAMRIVAVDLGYTHDEIDGWLRAYVPAEPM